MTDNIDFSVGDKFSPFEALSTKIAANEKSKCVQYYHHDSNTLENAKKKAPWKVDSSNKALKYYYVLYSCIFGGKEFHSTSKGKRPNQRLWNYFNDLIAHFVKNDSQYLTITDISDEHNHDISKEVYDHLPHQRELREEVKNDVEKLLQLVVNKKLLREHSTDTNLEKLIDTLKQIEGASIEVFTNSSGTLTGLFFQDGIMKSVYSAYPEMILVDATYKLNDVRMPLYLFLSINGNENSEIVLVFLTLLEGKDDIYAMIQHFKGHNP
uniref:MULE transposase domain-containing protein n=1 Tax=Amphimedon queenslandica TaxID=400682 RepID=A0A1X7TV94_AMPQE